MVDGSLGQSRRVYASGLGPARTRAGPRRGAATAAFPASAPARQTDSEAAEPECACASGRRGRRRTRGLVVVPMIRVIRPMIRVIRPMIRVIGPMIRVTVPLIRAAGRVTGRPRPAGRLISAVRGPPEPGTPPAFLSPSPITRRHMPAKATGAGRLTWGRGGRQGRWTAPAHAAPPDAGAVRVRRAARRRAGRVPQVSQGASPRMGRSGSTISLSSTGLCE